MHEPSSVDRKFWTDIDGSWTHFEQECQWTLAARPTSGDAKKYFDTIEHNLNMAVYYSAAAINYVLSKGLYTDCECDGDAYDRYPNPPESDQERQGSLQLTLDRYTTLLFFNFVGLISTAIALTIIPKNLEKLLSGLINLG
jgi:hypothetical protein